MPMDLLSLETIDWMGCVCLFPLYWAWWAAQVGRSR